MPAKVVITFGTFDVFHVGHLRMLERATSFARRLIVGAPKVQLSIGRKGHTPVRLQEE